MSGSTGSPSGSPGPGHALRRLLALSLALNALALVVLALFVERRGGPRYLLERAGLVEARQHRNPRQAALAEVHGRTPLLPGETILAGDSIIFRAPVHWYLSRVRNFGVPGEISDGLRQRIPAIADRRPERLVVQVGTNDLLRAVPVDEVVANLRAIVEIVRARSPETRITLLTVLPINFDGGRDHYQEEKVRTIPELNRRLVDLAREVGVELLDVAPAFGDDAGLLRAEYSAGDGTHLNEAGYRVYVERLRPVLTAFEAGRCPSPEAPR